MLKSSILFLFSAFGLIAFITITNTFSFRDNLFSKIFPKQPSYAATQINVLETIADTYVDDFRPTTNYGSTNTLIIDNDPIAYAYFKFDLSSLNGQKISNAKFRFKTILVSQSPQSSPIVKLVNDSSWDEYNITWINKPDISSETLGSIVNPSLNSWYELSIPSSLIQSRAGKNITIAIQSEDKETFAVLSRETDSKPQLIITSDTFVQ